MALESLKQRLLGLLKLSRGISTFARGRALRLHRRYQARGRQTEGGLEPKSATQRLAIVALNPDRHAVPFVVNLLNGLAENGFFVLLAAAKKLPMNFKNSVLPHCHHLIERFSIEREFGSIKAGLAWIEKRDEFEAIDTLAIVNDSFYYPKHISSTIGQMLEMEENWLSLFENSPARAQSFFQIFRAPVFKADKFVNFWHNRTLTPARLHAVVTGETGLVGALLKAGFASKAYYSAARLSADSLAAFENDPVPAGLQDTVNLTLGFERKDQDSRLPVRDQDAIILPASEVARRIGELAEGKNPAHAIGLVCNYLYQAPIKRDICSNNTLPADDLLALAQGFSTGEKKAIAADLDRPQAAANFAGIRHIPQRVLHTARVLRIL